MYYYISSSPNDLQHHGILGMKWGVRRYQNKDGSLTAAGRRHYGVDASGNQSEKGRKRASKEYHEYASRANDVLVKKHNETYINAYNKVAEEANKENSFLDQYNREHSPDDPDYEEGYERLVNKKVNQNVARMQLELMENNEDYKRAQWLVKQFGMEAFDEDVQADQETIAYLKKLIGER